jgi:hypothetical protein
VTLTDTRVSDLSTLIGQPLEKLHIERSPVADLTPIAGLPITDLTLIATKVTDLTPLAKSENLTTIRFNPAQLTDGIDVLRTLPALKTMATETGEPMPRDEFFKKYDAGEL